MNHGLEKAAKKKVAEKADSDDWDEPYQPDHRTGVISGIWTRPCVFSQQSKEVPEMYQDLVKLLAESRIPTVIMRGGEQTDVAEKLAEALFPFNPDPPSVIENFNKDDLEHHPRYALGLKDDENDVHIYAGHAYYSLPMGRSATDKTWHGALYVKALVSDKGSEQYGNMMEEFRFMEDIEPPTASTWLVTFQIAWKAIRVAWDGYKELKNILEKKKEPSYKVHYNFLDAQLQTIKIVVPAGYSPSDANFFLREAVAQAMKNLSNNKKPDFSDASEALTQYQTPTIILTDSTLIAGEVTTETMVVVPHH
ncbi:hypothetical protein CNMCM5623_000409 [Aspergillus felis]|uniref:Uncharacterized protein n=1 Tax=Aspergillus felis TaxID=1287682 RepID=A0A8H6UUV9_9EURO|nr:hypothetical protein CNMCM5623_000409 [Aspergillus felis]